MCSTNIFYVKQLLSFARKQKLSEHGRRHLVNDNVQNKIRRSCKCINYCFVLHTLLATFNLY